MTIEHNVGNTVETLKRMKERSLFNPYISRIVFPYFKNYSYFSELNFHFPLTVFVGKNGTGKSSALHALYGAPEGQNIGDFWFSTEMDPIEEFGEEKEKHSYYYEYENEEGKKEVLYHRMFHKRRNNPEYWETARGRKKYEMQEVGIRNKVVSKNLVHLDFRSELSAFDKFFYFGTVEKLKSKRKQDYLRIQSKQLKNAIESNSVRKIKTKEQNKKVINISSEELKMISFILEEDYVEGKLIEHKFFGSWGTSVILTRNDFSYSEAQAGSGEIAVVMLVHNIFNAEPQSLILLDEPEVSLHPGAQKQLLLALLDQIKKKKHQVVIATHSPIFTEGLPKQAIKRFVRNIDTDKTDIYDECYPSEAFGHLGLSSRYDGALIHVEDKLMKNVIDNIMEEEGERFKNIEVYFTPGGASDIHLNSIPHYSKDLQKKKFVYFDGDQSPKIEVPKIKDLTNEQMNPTFLSDTLFEITGSKIKFIKDGGDGEIRDDQLVKAQVSYLEYYREFVRFLPVLTPEELIWDYEYIKVILASFPREKVEQLQTFSTAKEKIYEASKILLGEKDDVNVDLIETLLVKHWLQKDNDHKATIIKDLDAFVDILHR